MWMSSETHNYEGETVSSDQFTGKTEDEKPKNGVGRNNMKKNILNLSTKSVLGGLFFTVIVILSSCPTPINEDMFLQVKDSMGPAIIISSPGDGAYCSKTVVVTGTVSDLSTDTGSTGQVKKLSYEILSTGIKEEVAFNKDGNFSFNINTTSLSSRFVLKISAEDWNGNTADSSITLNIQADNNIPSFTVNPGNYQVTLEWDDVPLASTYTVYYAAGGTIPSEQVGTSIADIHSPYVITGLDNGSYYTFLLASQSSDGTEINWSGYEFAIPLSPSTFIPQLRNEYGAISLSWGKIKGYDNFKVYRSNEVNGVYSNISGILSTNYYTDNSCEPDTNYYYKISPALEGSTLSSHAFRKSSIFESSRLEMIGAVLGLWTSFKWVRCEGNYLYVVSTFCFFGGCSYYFDIYDITNPEYPEQLGRTELTGVDPVQVAVHNNYAYAASSQYLDIIDIQDKTNPSIIGTCGGFTDIQGVAVSDTDICVADGSAGLRFIDITDIGNPVIGDTCDTAGIAHKAVLTPAYACVADGASGVQIIDLSTNAIIKTVVTGGNALSIELNGDYAYIADDTGGLSIIDISTPSSASVKQTCDTAGSAQDVTLADNFAYVCEGTDGLVEINVSDPASRTPFVSLTDSSVKEAVCITDYGDYSYVVDGGDEMAGIKIFYRNPNTPRMNYAGTISTAFSSYGAPLACDGNYFYAGSNDGKLSIIDMTSETEVSSYTTQEAQITAVILHGNYAIVSSGTLFGSSNFIEIVNIQDPQNPVLAHSLSFDKTMFCRAVSGDYAFAVGPGGMSIIDMSDPQEAFVKQTFGGVGWGVDVAIQDQYAYIAAYNSGFIIVDFSNLNALRIVGSVLLPDYAHSVVVKGSYAYVGVDSDSSQDYVQIIDISDPKFPTLISQSICDEIKPNRLTLDGDYLFSINGGYAMDVSNPAEPYRIELIPTIHGEQEFCDMLILGSKAYYQSSGGIDVINLIN